MDDVKIIPFSHNWNKKLDCDAFTTIRIENPRRFIQFEEYSITMKGQEIFKASIVSIKNFYLKDLNEFMSYLDTGYSIEQTRRIILQMYPNVDFTQKRLSFILLLKQK